MACKYTIKIGKKEETFNLMKLTEYYYKSTSQLANKNIYSSDEIVNSILNPIKEQLKKADEIYKDDSKTAVRDFITSDKNDNIFATVGIAHRGRLAPEYVKEKYILNSVINSLKDNHGIVVPDEYDIKEVLSKYSEAQMYYDNISEEIQIQEKTNKIGVVIHDILNKLILSNGDFNESLKKDLLKVIIESEDVLEGNPEEWKNKFIDILSKIYSDVSSGNKSILSEVYLRSEEFAPAQVKGKLDILAIDDNGQIYIYDLKLSRDAYSDWDSAKKQETDLQLAFYRALLGQYVNVKNATLNIIPIRLGGLNSNKKLELKNLFIDSIKNRLTEDDAKKLLPNGIYYRNVEKLIPETTSLIYDQERKNNIITDLKVLFSGYEIKTSDEIRDLNKMVDNAIKNHGFISSYSEFTSDKLKKSGEKFYVDETGKSEEEIRKIYEEVLNDYLLHIKLTENNNVVQLKQKIISAIDGKGASIEYSDDNQKQLINAIVNNYVNGEYRVVNHSDDLSTLGIILLQNKKYGTYVLLNVSSYTQRANFDNDLLMIDVDTMKAFTFLNHFVDELELNWKQIQAIHTFNIDKKEYEYRDIKVEYERYVDLMHKRGLQNNLKPEMLISLENRAKIELQEVQRNFMESFSETDPTKKTVQKIIDSYGESISDLPLYKLKLLQKEFLKAFPYLRDQSLKSGFNFNSKLEVFFGMIQTLLLIKSEQIPIGDFAGFNNFNIQWSSFKDLFAGVFSSNSEQYNKYGKKIGSFIDGLKTITPDKVGSRDLKNINIIISSTNSFIRQEMYKQSTDIKSLTDKFFDYIGFNSVERNWAGNAREKFERFWVKDVSGKISTEWKVKNPYLNDPANVLKPQEQEYLRNILFELNKRRLSIPKKEWDKIDVTSLDTIKNTASSESYSKIEKAIEKGSYFKMALIRSGRIDRGKGVFKDGEKSLSKYKDQWLKEWDDYIDSRELDRDELKKVKEEFGYYEMYDIYAKQSDEFKEKAISENTTDYFELDLDTIAHRVTFHQIRKVNVDTILPIINAYAWWMKLTAGKGNMDISNELEYLTNRMKQGIFDESIIDQEFEDIIKATSGLKSITTAGMLAFRPALFMKEMIIGMYKGITLAAIKIYGGEQFTIKDFTKAIKKLASTDKKFSTEWNLIDGLNNYYGFANRDVNTIYKKLQTNRRGALLGLGPWMYSMNTIPDYYNRLALFLAKMIHDGSYDAHTLDEKQFLRYDPTKDKRFSYYFEKRSSYINPDPESKYKYLPAPNDLEYNKQRAAYNLLISELNAENIRAGREIYEEGDIVDKAYSELERASFKSFTDTVYGYYDADSQAEWHKTWYGILYLQFLQFWPGKMSMWFGTAKNEDLSPTGYHRQKKSKSGQLVWREPVTNEEGHVIAFEETETNTGDPAYEWVGTAQEGLFQSMLKTAKDIAKMDWQNIKDEDLRTRRALYGLADGVLMIIIFGIIWQILQGIIADEGTDGISGETLRFMENVNQKVLNESNLWGNTFGALRSEPAFWTYSTKVAGDIIDVIEGDKSLMKAVSQRIRAFEFVETEE